CPCPVLWTRRTVRSVQSRARALAFAGANCLAAAQARGSDVWTSLPEVLQCVHLEEGRGKLHARIEAALRIRLDTGNRRLVAVDILPTLEGHVRGLIVVHLAVRAGERLDGECHDLKRVEQVALPGELAIPGALEGFLVDVELEFAIQV